eukprot:3645169-Rhodomonas_salina.6
MMHAFCLISQQHIARLGHSSGPYPLQLASPSQVRTSHLPASNCPATASTRLQCTTVHSPSTADAVAPGPSSGKPMESTGPRACWDVMARTCSEAEEGRTSAVRRRRTWRGTKRERVRRLALMARSCRCIIARPATTAGCSNASWEGKSFAGSSSLSRA